VKKNSSAGNVTAVTAEGKASASELRLTVGLDLGDRRSRYCVLDQNGIVIQEESVPSTRDGLKRIPGAAAGSRIIIEVGAQSSWISRYLKELGFDVIVANARKVAMISKSTRKNDRMDAQTLARLGRVDPALLSPIRHRGEQSQRDLAVIRIRAEMVEQRTALINCARGTAKAMGERLPVRESDHFGVDMLAGDKFSKALQQILKPLLTMIEHLSQQIAVYDEQIEAMAKQYPQVKVLTQLYGVGNLIGLTYLLTLEDPGRFPVSRDVGPYLGLVPKQRDSGNSQPQMHITKEGDRYLRKLLVQAAQCMLKKTAPETDLKRWAEGHFRPGDKQGKKKTVVGLARRIAVLLHKLWANGEVYDPNYQQKHKARAKAA